MYRDNEAELTIPIENISGSWTQDSFSLPFCLRKKSNVKRSSNWGGGLYPFCTVENSYNGHFLSGWDADFGCYIRQILWYDWTNFQTLFGHYIQWGPLHPFCTVVCYGVQSTYIQLAHMLLLHAIWLSRAISSQLSKTSVVFLLWKKITIAAYPLDCKYM